MKNIYHLTAQKFGYLSRFTDYLITVNDNKKFEKDNDTHQEG